MKKSDDWRERTRKTDEPRTLLHRQVLSILRLELPTFLLLALGAGRRERNGFNASTDSAMSLSEYVTQRLVKQIRDKELRELYKRVPGSRAAAENHARWVAAEREKKDMRRRDAAAKQPTSLGAFMKIHGVRKRAIWSTGVVARRVLSGLISGRYNFSPTLRTLQNIKIGRAHV